MTFFIATSTEGPSVADNMKALAQRSKDAAKKAGDDTAAALIQADRADIQGAGNFGPRWTNSLSSTVTQKGGGVTVTVKHGAPNYFSVFETGAVISGKPYLWIPADNVFAGPKQGPLFLAKPKGKYPVLVGPDHDVRYIGVPAVELKPRFHLAEIEKEVGGQIGARYDAALKEDGGE